MADSKRQRIPVDSFTSPLHTCPRHGPYCSLRVDRIQFLLLAHNQIRIPKPLCTIDIATRPPLLSSLVRLKLATVVYEIFNLHLIANTGPKLLSLRRIDLYLRSPRCSTLL